MGLLLLKLLKIAPCDKAFKVKIFALLLFKVTYGDVETAVHQSRSSNKVTLLKSVFVTGILLLGVTSSLSGRNILFAFKK